MPIVKKGGRKEKGIDDHDRRDDDGMEEYSSKSTT